MPLEEEKLGMKPRCKCVWGCQQVLSAVNQTDNKQHLLKCQAFLVSQKAQELAPEHHEVMDAVSKVRGMGWMERDRAVGWKRSSTQAVLLPSVSSSSSRGFAVDRISAAEKAELDLLFARMVFLLNIPHSIVDHPAAEEFFHKLRPAYQLPSR